MAFGLLPPEINSGRMYIGPGSAPLLAAAGSWDSLAAEVAITAEAYGSVLLSLTTLHWRGPASVSMQSAAATYTRWLHTTADQAKQTAIQARAAAAAFEQAHAMTVPPPLVAANRARLSLLQATNFLGQNTAAIAATEAEYVEMWLQDATAMYVYAASSAAALQLTPFTPPQETTNPTGLAAQGVAGAASIAAAGEEIPGAEFDAVDAIYSMFTGVQTCQSLVMGVIQTGKMTGVDAAVSARPVQNLLPLIPAMKTPQGVPGSALAMLGRANRIGPLAVPSNWAAPSGGLASALSGTGLTTLPGTDELAGSRAGTPAIPFVSNPSSRASGVVPRYGSRLTVMSRPPAAG